MNLNIDTDHRIIHLTTTTTSLCLLLTAIIITGIIFGKCFNDKEYEL